MREAVNYELERVCWEVVVACCKELSQHLPGSNDELAKHLSVDPLRSGVDHRSTKENKHSIPAFRARRRGVTPLRRYAILKRVRYMWGWTDLQINCSHQAVENILIPVC